MLLMIGLILALVIGSANATWPRLLLSLLLVLVLTLGFWLALVAPGDPYAFGYALGKYLVPAVVFIVLAVIAHLIRRAVRPRRRRGHETAAAKTFE